MAKSMKPTLETGPQTRAAIREIQAKTRWSLRRIADEAGMTRETLRKIDSEKTISPGEIARTKVATLLQRVRKMK